MAMYMASMPSRKPPENRVAFDASAMLPLRKDLIPTKIAKTRMIPITYLFNVCGDDMFAGSSVTLSATLKQAPTFFVGFAPRLAFDLHPTALLAGSVRGVSTLRDNALEAHAIGGLQELEAIIEAFGIVQPVGICGQD